jgi:hypothetical protein
MTMTDSKMILLLQLINSNSDVGPLVRIGLRYSQIARLLSQAIEEGYLIEEDDKLKLSEKGIFLMRSNRTEKRQRRDGGWISPEEGSRRKQESRFKIYLPPKDWKC